MSRQIGNGYYGQSNYIQGQQLLSHPTRYHLEETERRRQTLASDGCSPPTPASSFHSTIDPGVLQQQYTIGHIKQESGGSYDVQQEIDYPVISPDSGSPTTYGSPHNATAFEDNDLCQSYRPQSHLASMGGSPGGHEIGGDYYGETEFCPMSAPTSIPVDVKPIRTNNRQPMNINHISMSLPAQTIGSWPYGTSVDIQPGSLPYSSGAEMQMMPNFLDPDDADNHKQQLLSEKRRRRRESHNAVERRRRDNINEKIAELSTLLPEVYIDSTNKPNKGVILRKSVEYIRNLQRMLQENNRLLEEQRLRNSELETQVKDMSSASRMSMEGTSGGSFAKRTDMNASSLPSSGLDGSLQAPSLGSNNFIS